MSVAVEFVTLGDASKNLGVPSPTLRLWTDELEKNEVHFVKRNHRDERVYYDNDLEIFAFMRDLKKEHGRKTQTKDIALMIYQKAVENNMFDLRRSEDAPKPESSTVAIDILNNEDIKKMMESERVKQFVGIIINETTKNLKDEWIKEVRESVREEVRKEMQDSQETLKESLDDIVELQKVNNDLLNETVQESRASRIKREEAETQVGKGFFSKLFGK